jgi:hypothetical protein
LNPEQRTELIQKVRTERRRYSSPDAISLEREPVAGSLRPRLPGDGDRIALMDFVTTTPFDPNKSVVYDRPPKRVLLEEYRAADLKSALYTEAKQRIDEIEGQVEDRIERLEKRVEFFIGAAFVIITLLFAALAVLFTYGKDTSVPVWSLVNYAISLLALLVAFLAQRRSKMRR